MDFRIPQIKQLLFNKLSDYQLFKEFARLPARISWVTRDVLLKCSKIAPVHNYAPRQEDVLGEWRYCDQFHTPTAFSRGKNPSAHRIGGWSTPHLCVIPKGNGKYSRLLAFV
jgi:hypothetical protein